jgi:hypothetical protein
MIVAIANTLHAVSSTAHGCTQIGIVRDDIPGSIIQEYRDSGNIGIRYL